MNREETKAARLVMQHFEEGGTVEFRARSLPSWHEHKNPKWDWEHCEYRIKPKPLECWVWVEEYKGGIVALTFRYEPQLEPYSKEPGRWVRMVEWPNENP